jgi:hypothetical protein
VEIGLQGTMFTEIKKGLKPGEVVVTAFVQPQALTPPQQGGGRFGGGPMGGMRGLMRR